MKPKLIFKIILDFVMTILYAVLVFRFGTGELFHELAGICFAVLYIVHIALNAGRIRYALKNDISKLSKRSRALLILDALLLTGISAVMITGVLTAYELYSLEFVTDTALLYAIHNVASYAVLGILGLHLLLHAKYLYRSVKAIAKNLTSPPVRRALISAAALTAAVLVIYGIVFASLDETADEAGKGSAAEYSAPSSTREADEAAGYDANGTNTIGNDTAEEQLGESQESKSVTEDEEKADETGTLTLNDFLEKLNCNGCGRRCSLLNPHCGKGEKQAEEAKTEYYELYGNETGEG